MRTKISIHQSSRALGIEELQQGWGYFIAEADSFRHQSHVDFANFIPSIRDQPAWQLSKRVNLKEDEDCTTM
jgi:hypothetical protein